MRPQVKIQHIFAAIQRERDRQDAELPGEKFTVAQELVAIHGITGEASDSKDFLVIAAIAVRALQNHGLPGEVKNGA